MIRRRWVIRPRNEDGAPEGATVVGIAVVNGSVVLAAPAGPVTLQPADVSRLRQVLLDAQAAALIERGRW